MAKFRDDKPTRDGAPSLSLRVGGGWRDAMEVYGQAVSLAEAGAQDLAIEMLGEFHAEHRKILMLDETGGVPEAMATYGINLAERLGFDLVLLSVNATPETDGRFEERSRQAALPMLKEAARRGVSCAHLCRSGACDEVLNAVSLELRRVEFVITRRPESVRRTSALLVPEFSLKC